MSERTRYIVSYPLVYMLAARSHNLRRLFHRTLLSIPLLILSLLITMSFPLPTSAISSSTPLSNLFGFTRMCDTPIGENVACGALLADKAVTEPSNANPTSGSAPYTPSDLHKAYHLPNTTEDKQ